MSQDLAVKQMTSGIVCVSLDLHMHGPKYRRENFRRIFIRRWRNEGTHAR